jgi:hypothetical protein
VESIIAVATEGLSSSLSTTLSIPQAGLNPKKTTIQSSLRSTQLLSLRQNPSDRIAKASVRMSNSGVSETGLGSAMIRLDGELKFY